MIGTRDFADLRPQIRRIYVTFLRIWGAKFLHSVSFSCGFVAPVDPVYNQSAGRD